MYNQLFTYRKFCKQSLLTKNTPETYYLVKTKCNMTSNEREANESTACLQKDSCSKVIDGFNDDGYTPLPQEKRKLSKTKIATFVAIATVLTSTMALGKFFGRSTDEKYIQPAIFSDLVNIYGSDSSSNIQLYEGNYGSQDFVCQINAFQKTEFSFKDSRNYYKCTNDEARSLVLNNVRAGTTITVYDTSDANTKDDWTTIYVKKTSARQVIGTFERSFQNEYVKVTYHKAIGKDGWFKYYKPGLDGKVSRIKIQVN